MPDHQIESDVDRIASTMLDVLLDYHPAHLSAEEVIREVAADPSSFSDRSETDEAIRELVRAGLLHRSGEFVFATRAAVRASELGI